MAQNEPESLWHANIQQDDKYRRRMFETLMANSLVSSGICMCGCVRMKLPTSRSSVKPCVPLPTVSTNIVEGP